MSTNAVHLRRRLRLRQHPGLPAPSQVQKKGTRASKKEATSAEKAYTACHGSKQGPRNSTSQKIEQVRGLTVQPSGAGANRSAAPAPAAAPSGAARGGVLRWGRGAGAGTRTRARGAAPRAAGRGTEQGQPRC